MKITLDIPDGIRVMHQMIDDLARALTEGDSDDEA